MRSKLTTKDVGEAIEGLDLLPLVPVCSRHFRHRDRVAVLTDADGIHHGFVAPSRPGLCGILSVDESFEVQVCRHGGCSDKECKSES